MMRALVSLLILCAVLAISGHAPVRAEPVSQEYLGLEVAGNLEIASGKSLAADGAVLIVHGSLAHHRLEIIKTLQDNLKARGVNTLAVTLSLGIGRRQGMLDCKLEQDHRHGDAADEITAWVEWLQRKGAGKVSLLGHSRGGAQAALAMVERADLGVDRLVLVAPLQQTDAEIAARYQADVGQPLEPLLEKAHKLIENGEGDSLIDVPAFMHCRPAKLTAAAFHDYYAPDPQQGVMRLLEDIGAPVLMVLAGDDKVVPGLAKVVSDAAAKGLLARNVTVATVDGADHFFRDLFADDLADRVAEFLGKP